MIRRVKPPTGSESGKAQTPISEFCSVKDVNRASDSFDLTAAIMTNDDDDQPKVLVSQLGKKFETEPLDG